MILFVSDYDNTLCLPDQGIAPSDLDALNQFVQSGNLFAVATGRSCHSVRSSARPYHLPAQYWICANGAAVFYGEQMLKRQIINARKLQEIITCGIDAGVLVYEFGNGQDSFILEADPSADLSDQIKGACMEHFSGMDEIVQAGFAFAHPEAMDQCRGMLEQISGIRMHINSVYIDITDISASKEDAVSYLQNLCAAETVCTLGDDWNDLGMLERFDGFLMECAPEKLKQQYRNTVTSAAECLRLLEKEANNSAY